MKTLDVRKDFVLLQRCINEEPLIYLDNAATTQKPRPVIEAVEQFYQRTNANVHRGVYTLGYEATERYEAAREKVRAFIRAKTKREVVFTRGTTMSLNWVAKGFVAPLLRAGDELFISPMEHHANLVVWQQVAKQTGATLTYMPLLPTGEIDLVATKQRITKQTKVIAVAHVSNVLGIENDIRQLAEWIHAVQGVIVVDGAQAVPHRLVDVNELDCDFYAFSAHKMLGPTGIGVLYGKEKWLEQMEPQEFGGDMIEFVYDQSSTWAPLPYKLEAGTPNIAGAIGLGAAIDYLNEIGMDAILNHEQELMAYVLPKLQQLDGLTIYGPQEASKRTNILSFNVDGIHPHDVATALDARGIAVRAGHHCAQPFMRFLNVAATVRASFYLYNTKEEADMFVDVLAQVKEYFANGVF